MRRAVLAAAALAWSAPPDWAVSGKWPSCPPSSCWTGVGSGSTPEQARQSAMGDVSRQVRARIRSDSRDSRWEEDGRAGEASSVRSDVRSDERIDGIQVVQQTQDGALWYAMAVLDRSALAAPGRSAMAEAARDGLERSKQLREAIQGGRLHAASDELSAILAAKRRYSDARDKAALGEPGALSESFPLSPAVLDSLARELRTSLLLVAPDTVQVPRDAPASALVPVRANWRGFPVGDLDLELVDAAGRSLAHARTDSRGEAVLHPALATAAPWSIRAPDADPAWPERKLSVRWTGAARNWKISGDSTAGAWREEVERALARSGWSLDPVRGQSLSAALSIRPKGTLEGVSGTVHRVGIRLELGAKGRESTCEASSIGATDEEAVRSALRKLDCAPF